jgi:hypothetical protein
MRKPAIKKLFFISRDFDLLHILFIKSTSYFHLSQFLSIIKMLFYVFNLNLDLIFIHKFWPKKVRECMRSRLTFTLHPKSKFGAVGTIRF